jgi:uncharacterized GH25 family protein
MFAVTLAAVVALPGLGAADDKTGQTPSGPKAAPAPNSTTFDLRIGGPDGKPVPDAKVELRSTPTTRAEHVRVGKYQRRARYGVSITSDSNGRLVFDRPVDWKHLDIFIEIPGYAPYWAGWDSDRNSEPIPSSLAVKLEAGWRIGGVVVDSEGKPITGAQIWPSIEFTKRPGESRQLAIGTHLRTDSDGRWTYESVPNSMASVPVEISKPGFMTSRTSLTRGEFGHESGRLPSARIVLKSGLIVTGKVTDESGQPIGGVVVRTKFFNSVHKAVTGADGTYTLSGCEPGEVRIVASAKGRATEMQEVAIGPRTAKVDFEMKAGRTIRIRVLDERGNPVPKARIFFQSWRGRFQYFEFDQVSQFADKQGVWEWREAPVDTFLADICRPEGMQLSRQQLLARNEEYVFRVPPALVVSGKVVDAQTRQPIKKFQVVPGTLGSWNVSDAFTAFDGQYRIRETYAQFIYRVRIEADGYLPAESREIKTDEGAVTINFDLTKGKDVAGTVLTSDGVPAAGAKVALGVAGSQIMVTNGDISDSQTYCARQKTDDIGHFHFPPQNRDFWLVITHRSGFAELKGTPNANPMSIRLTPWARIEGSFRVARKLEPNVAIWINQWAHNRMGPNEPHIFVSYRHSTDGNGRFTFDRVAPGEARIGRDLQLMANEGSLKMTSSGMVLVKLTSGKTTQIDLGTSGSPVIGQLQQSPDSQQEVHWDFALVEADGNDLHFAATVDHGGGFCIDDVPAGQYSLSVRFLKPGRGRLEGHRFTVPAINEKLSQRPVDLGVLTLKSGGGL